MGDHPKSKSCSARAWGAAGVCALRRRRSCCGSATWSGFYKWLRGDEAPRPDKQRARLSPAGRPGRRRPAGSSRKETLSHGRPPGPWERPLSCAQAPGVAPRCGVSVCMLGPCACEEGGCPPAGSGTGTRGDAAERPRVGVGGWREPPRSDRPARPCSGRARRFPARVRVPLSCETGFRTPTSGLCPNECYQSGAFGGAQGDTTASPRTFTESSPPSPTGQALSPAAAGRVRSRPDSRPSPQRNRARPRAWAAGVRSTTSSSCGCPPTSSGTPPASSAPSAASTWTRRARAS